MKTVLSSRLFCHQPKGLVVSAGAVITANHIHLKCDTGGLVKTLISPQWPQKIGRRNRAMIKVFQHHTDDNSSTTASSASISPAAIVQP
jgi:hypothetical protein